MMILFKSRVYLNGITPEQSIDPINMPLDEYLIVKKSIDSRRLSGSEPLPDHPLLKTALPEVKAPLNPIQKIIEEKKEQLKGQVLEKRQKIKDDQRAELVAKLRNKVEVVKQNIDEISTVFLLEEMRKLERIGSKRKAVISYLNGKIDAINSANFATISGKVNQEMKASGDKGLADITCEEMYETLDPNGVISEE
jgi:hypothetical protein